MSGGKKKPEVRKRVNMTDPDSVLRFIEKNANAIEANPLHIASLAMHCLILKELRTLNFNIDGKEE